METGNRKRLVSVVLALALVSIVVLASGCIPNSEAGTGASEARIETLSPEEAFALIQENQGNRDFVILDVRSPFYHAAGHLANAVTVDYSTEPLRNVLDRLDKDRTYLVYEQAPCDRCVRPGLSMFNLLSDLNFREAYILRGGYQAWVAAGLPVTK
jgi:rhodanese-related sulfurtransferase